MLPGPIAVSSLSALFDGAFAPSHCRSLAPLPFNVIRWDTFLFGTIFATHTRIVCKAAALARTLQHANPMPCPHLHPKTFGTHFATCKPHAIN